MNPKLIVINSKTYNSVDEMPEDVRKQYEEAMSTLKDENKNHVPDAFENMNFFTNRDRDGIPDLFEAVCWLFWLSLGAQNSGDCRRLDRSPVNTC
ncbi:MAG: hypothetical protein ACXW4M_13170 [Anaerolineales bacterium]